MPFVCPMIRKEVLSRTSTKTGLEPFTHQHTYQKQGKRRLPSAVIVRRSCLISINVRKGMMSRHYVFLEKLIRKCRVPIWILIAKNDIGKNIDEKVDGHIFLIHYLLFKSVIENENSSNRNDGINIRIAAFAGVIVSD